jgi:hypothetical protein
MWHGSGTRAAMPGLIDRPDPARNGWDLEVRLASPPAVRPERHGSCPRGTRPRFAVAGLMAAIVALGIATSAGSVCRSAASRNHAWQFRSARCQSTANGLPK